MDLAIQIDECIAATSAGTTTTGKSSITTNNNNNSSSINSLENKSVLTRNIETLCDMCLTVVRARAPPAFDSISICMFKRLLQSAMSTYKKNLITSQY